METLADRLHFCLLNAPDHLGKRLTKADLARACAVSTAAVSMWFSGKTLSLAGNTLTRAAKYFNVDPHWLSTGEGPIPMWSNVAEGPDIKGTVPLISWVQAGEWQTVIDNLLPGQGERIETTWKARAHTYALRVIGDSMEPKFPDGCIIIVEPEEVAQSGSFVVVRQNGDEATFKQLISDGSQKWLKPLNPRYPIMPMSNDAVLCGVVKRLEMDI